MARLAKEAVKINARLLRVYILRCETTTRRIELALRNALSELAMFWILLGDRKVRGTGFCYKPRQERVTIQSTSRIIFGDAVWQEKKTCLRALVWKEKKGAE